MLIQNSWPSKIAPNYENIKKNNIKAKLMVKIKRVYYV